MSVVIYVKPTCPYCRKAIQVLNRTKVLYTTVDLTKEPGRKPEMIKKANGASTVPQIFVNGTHIGDCNRLVALEKSGQLRKILGLLP